MADPQLAETLALAPDLDAVLSALVSRLGHHRSGGLAVYYVAGAISADGDDRIPRNIRSLQAQCAHVSALHRGQAFVFCAPDILNFDLLTRLGLLALPRDARELALQQFWSRVLHSRQIDGIYFARGWDRSPGANSEHTHAGRLAIPVTYL